MRFFIALLTGVLCVFSTAHACVDKEGKKTAFEKLDTDQNGTLDKDEFMPSIEAHVSWWKRNDVFESMDRDESGTISLEEYDPWAGHENRPKPRC